MDITEYDVDKLDALYSKISKAATRINWHKWFAWYPVRLDSYGYIWLKWVERKGTYTQTYYQEASLTQGNYVYDYKLIENKA